ncbi:MAG TPA: NIPSNAP family protein [Tepidisphaeraceae bacterium]
MVRLPRLTVSVAVLALCAILPGVASAADEQSAAPAGGRFFELRVYTTAEGKLDALKARFRDHTNDLFRKHGMEIIGFWTPAEGPKSQNTLIYILAYPSKEAREKSWKEFEADPDWKKARAESEKNGKIVLHVESTFMTPTDFSPMK